MATLNAFLKLMTGGYSSGMNKVISDTTKATDKILQASTATDKLNSSMDKASHGMHNMHSSGMNLIGMIKSMTVSMVAANVVMAGMQANQFSYEVTNASRQSIAFQNYDFAYLSTGTGNMSMSGGGDRYNLMSYFGKFNYSFDSKYLLSGSIRYDGSSKFGANNRFGLFPALSGGWRISSEDFMAKYSFLSDLNLPIPRKVS